MTYRPKQQTCCAVLTDRSELPWFNNKKQNKTIKQKTKQNKTVQQQWMRASKKRSGIVDGHFGPLRRAPAESKSLCGWRSFVNGRVYDYQRKRKIQLWWRVTSLSHTRFTMSHTTQTQTRPLTLTSPLFLTFDWQDAEILGLKHIMAFIQTQGSCGTGVGQGMGARVYMCWLEKSDSQ